MSDQQPPTNTQRQQRGGATVWWIVQASPIGREAPASDAITEVLSWVAHFCEHANLDPAVLFGAALDRWRDQHDEPVVLVLPGTATLYDVMMEHLHQQAIKDTAAMGCTCTPTWIQSPPVGPLRLPMWASDHDGTCALVRLNRPQNATQQ